jgi:hypothetical protein
MEVNMAQGELSPENTRLSIAIKKEDKEKLSSFAKDDCRKLSSLVQTILNNYIKIRNNKELYSKLQEILIDLKV